MTSLQLHTSDSLTNNKVWAHIATNGARIRPASRLLTRLSVAPAAATSWSTSRQTIEQQLVSHICHAEGATSSAPTSGSRRVRRIAKPIHQQQQQQQQQLHQQTLPQPAHKAQQLQAEPQQNPIRVAAHSSINGVAKAVLYQLQHFGKAEVWATSAANHFTAVIAVAEAHKQLQQRHQQGLAAVASLSASDQPVADEQKKGLKKLTLHVTAADPVQEQVWECSPTDAAASNSTGHLSTTRTKAVADVMQLLLQQLSMDAGAAAVVECRGEQAVTRALKAALSLQASQGLDMLLQPWPGQVVDVVAEKRGEQGRLVDGLLLRMSWAQQQQQQQ